MKKKMLVALTVSLLSFSVLSTSFAAKSVRSAPTTDGRSSAWAG